MLNLNRFALAFGILALSAVGVQAATVTPNTATTDMVVRAFFAGDATLNNINNIIDGNTTTGFVTENPTGTATFGFTTAVNNATGIKLWNNAGFIFTEGESIGKMDVTVRDAANVVLFQSLGALIPEGAAGDPYTISFGGTLNGVKTIALKILANNGATGDLDGVAYREIAVETVPEPAGLGVLGALGLVGLVRRRK